MPAVTDIAPHLCSVQCRTRCLPLALFTARWDLRLRVASKYAAFVWHSSVVSVLSVYIYVVKWYGNGFGEVQVALRLLPQSHSLTICYSYSRSEQSPSPFSRPSVIWDSSFKVNIDLALHNAQSLYASKHSLKPRHTLADLCLILKLGCLLSNYSLYSMEELLNNLQCRDFDFL